MGRPKGSKNKVKDELEVVQPGEAILPNGCHFGVVQLMRDLSPHPAAQRIVQWVNRNGEIKAYISESAYHRTELKSWFDKLFRDSYSASISKGGAALSPVKSRLHWIRFEPGFLTGQVAKPERVNPETDGPEEEL
jgi:hypothetical protein